MPIDGVGSCDDIYRDDIEIQDLKAYDIRGAEWNGRRVLKTRDDRSIHPMLAASLAYEQAARRKIYSSIDNEEGEYESGSFANFGAPHTFTFNNPFIPSPGSSSHYNQPPRPVFTPPPPQIPIFAPLPPPPQRVFIPPPAPPPSFPRHNYTPPPLITPTLPPSHRTYLPKLIIIPRRNFHHRRRLF